MSNHTRTAGLVIAAVGLIAPTLATAWTPYGYNPYGPGYYQSDQPYLGPAATERAAESSASGAEQQMPAYPPGPFGGYEGGNPYSAPAPTDPEAQGYGYGPPSFMPFDFPPGFPGGFPGAQGPRFGGPGGGLQVTREATEDAYILNIELNGTKPQEVQVRTRGQWISVGRDRSEQQTQEDTFDDGRGFRRSYSYSSGTAKRRFMVPRDADLSAMRREESENAVRIVIPRTRYGAPEAEVR